MTEVMEKIEEVRKELNLIDYRDKNRLLKVSREMDYLLLQFYFSSNNHERDKLVM